MIDEAEVLTQLAEAASGPPYFYRPIPCELDWKIAEVVEFLMQATEDARAVLLQRAKTDGLLGVLGAAAARLATLAVATSDVTLLRRAMAAMAMMGGFRDNPREASLEVGRVYAAALALHKSPRRLLKWGARFARSADDASYLITFAESKRDPWKGLPWGEYSPFRGGPVVPIDQRDHRLTSGNVQTRQDPGGLTWTRSYEPGTGFVDTQQIQRTSTFTGAVRSI